MPEVISPEIHSLLFSGQLERATDPIEIKVVERHLMLACFGYAEQHGLLPTEAQRYFVDLLPESSRPTYQTMDTVQWWEELHEVAKKIRPIGARYDGSTDQLLSKLRRGELYYHDIGQLALTV